MANCSKCGAALIAGAKFCAGCGVLVAKGTGTARMPSAPPPPGPIVAPRSPSAPPRAPSAPPQADGPASKADPYAKTLMSEEVTRAPSVSPLASSSAMRAPAPRGAPAGYIGTPWNIAPIAPPPPAAPPPSYGPGALVLVHWADGNRYPATVLQASGNQVLVRFPSGLQQWVDLRYVSTGI